MYIDFKSNIGLQDGLFDAVIHYFVNALGFLTSADDDVCISCVPRRAAMSRDVPRLKSRLEPTPESSTSKVCSYIKFYCRCPSLTWLFNCIFLNTVN